jgi:hypothetical protein
MHGAAMRTLRADDIRSRPISLSMGCNSQGAPNWNDLGCEVVASAGLHRCTLSGRTQILKDF